MKIATDVKVEKDTKKSSFINNIKVKTKILVGFATVLVVLGVVAAMGYTSLVTISHEVELYAHEVEESKAAASVEAHFFELEVFVREFAATSNMEDAKKAREIAVKLRAEIAKAQGLFKNPEQLEKLAEISKDFEIYVKDFEKVVELDVEFEKLIHEVLDPTGEAFVDNIDIMLEEVVQEGNGDAAIYIGVAREHALKAEVYANIMIGRRDDSFTEKVHHEFNEVEAALLALGKAIRTGEERKLRALLVEELARPSLCSVRSGNLASPRAGVYPGAGRSVILVIHESVQTNMENQYAERPG